jgi:phage N-6-adenine-methyltransferase
MAKQKPGTFKAAHDDPLRELRQSWTTPRDTFDELNEVFRFSIDACASAENALLPRYWSREDDCRGHSWAGERVFCNPPFSETSSILPKTTEADLAVVLLPVTAIVTIYYCQYPATWMLLPARRMRFIPPPGLNPKNNRTPTLGTLIAVYGNATEEEVRSLGHVVYRTTV